MSPLSELRKSLILGKPPSNSDSSDLPGEPTGSYAVRRFFLSWTSSGNLGLDQAVLLRQALRWLEQTSLLLEASPILTQDFVDCLLRVGIRCDANNELHVDKFDSDYLGKDSVIDRIPEERSCDESFHSEAYLASLGYESWRSQAQKEGAWATLQAPNGSTTVVVLPTGSGKSLCFQLLPRFSAGLTVVIVPTTALAIDQQVNAKKIFDGFSDVNPLYYASGDDAEATLKAVKDRKTRLLFTSPESCVAGRLRPILNDLTAKGWFSNLVLDEAHLVETWGAQFRVEFQLLSALRRRWLEDSGGKIRTYLFSATMSSNCRNLLQKMFSSNGLSSEFVCQRIRPEIEYYSCEFSNTSQRDERVVQLLSFLPRPAILYVTKVEDSKKLLARLREEGFVRSECFHGGITNAGERRDILRRWKNNEIDLMVATSAFGVGVDKGDVRTVIHACYPENLDRYYQEVGRGGRDGYRSVSLFLPAKGDRNIAKSLSVSLLKPETIQARWQSMYELAEVRGDHIYALPVSCRQLDLIGTRTYATNIIWNKSLLLQLERAEHLTITDIEYRIDESVENNREEWIVVKLLDFSGNNPAIAGLIRDHRNSEVVNLGRGLEMLDEFLAAKKCGTRVIANLYGIKGVRCPGCPYCRSQLRAVSRCEPLDFAASPTYTPDFRTELVEGIPSPLSSVERDDFIDCIYRCVTSKGIRQFFCPSKHFDAVLSSFNEAFGPNATTLYRLDPLDDRSKISSKGSLPAVFFHINNVNFKAMEIGRDYPSVHLFCSIQHPYNQNRHVAVDYDVRRWPSIASWISEPLGTSLPCLPINL